MNYRSIRKTPQNETSRRPGVCTALLTAALLSTTAGSAQADNVRGRLVRERVNEAQDRALDLREQTGEIRLVDDNQSDSSTLDIAATIPAGARALVVLDTALDSSKHGQGHRFTGTLSADIPAANGLIATRGSQVHGQVVSARRPRNVAGQSTLELKLTGIMVGDQLRTIESGIYKVSSARTAGDSLRKTGKAAAIGGLADGSDGAEAGAKVGGAAALVSKGQTAAVAAGTVMELPIGEPGSGLAQQVSESIAQPEEQSIDRVRDRRGDRRRR